MNTDNGLQTKQSILKRTAATLSVFVLTLFLSYSTSTGPSGLYKSSPYSSIDATSDAELAMIPGAIKTLDVILAKLKTKAEAKKVSGGDEAFNTFISDYLAAVDSIDESLKSDSDYTSTYEPIFKYIYPRALAMIISKPSIFDLLSKAMGSDEDNSTNPPTIVYTGTAAPIMSSDAKIESSDPNGVPTTTSTTTTPTTYTCPAGKHLVGGTLCQGNVKECIKQGRKGTQSWNGTMWAPCDFNSTLTITASATQPATPAINTSITPTTAPNKQTCTSFTYTSYGECDPDGTQTRHVLTKSPAGCTGGTPATLTKSCEYFKNEIPTNVTSCRTINNKSDCENAKSTGLDYLHYYTSSEFKFVTEKITGMFDCNKYVNDYKNPDRPDIIYHSGPAMQINDTLLIYGNFKVLMLCKGL